MKTNRHISRSGLFIAALLMLNACTLVSKLTQHAPGDTEAASAMPSAEASVKSADVVPNVAPNTTPNVVPNSAPIVAPVTAAPTAAVVPANASVSANAAAAATPAIAAKPSAELPATKPAAERNTDRLFSGTGVFVKPVTPSAAAPSGPEEFNLNFESADIRAIAQSILGDYLRESFTIHPQTAGTATIRLSRAVSRKDLIPMLEMLLRQNGQVMVREDGLYKIMPMALGTRGTTTPQQGVSVATLPNGYSVQIVQPKYVGVNDLAKILEPYVIDATSVRKDELRNLLILSGTQRELKHLIEIVDLFDVDFLAGYSIGLFQMSTDVKALSADLDRIFGSAAASPLAGIVKIIPIERMNGLLVVTTQKHYLDEAKVWIDRLDKSGGVTGGLRLNVYPVLNGKAEKLADLLSQIYGKSGSSSQPALAPGARPAQIATPAVAGAAPAAAPAQSVSFTGDGLSVSKDVRIIADADNNALLIMASPSDYETIEAALKKLDVARRQVMVEVTVAQVKLTDNLKFGVDWFINSRAGLSASASNAANAGSKALNRTFGTSNFGGALPTTPTGTPAAFAGLQLINTLGGDIRGILQALGQDDRAQLMSAPKILVVDNEKATINVGTKISVSTGTTTVNGGTTSSTQYIDTGVLLTVTPRINAGGRVTMEINQEVSSPSGSGTNPNIDSTKVQTVVTVPTGETFALGGLIQNTKASGSTGIPLLSKIPLIGGLFGLQSLDDTRNELVLVITPTVVNDNTEARAVTDELRRKLPALDGILPRAKSTDAAK